MSGDIESKSRAHVNRRGFLKTTIAGAAAITAPAAFEDSKAQSESPRSAALPTEAGLAAETGAVLPPLPSTVIEHPQSDFMVDLMRSLGVEFAAANPGSSFDSLQESIINYGDNRDPEFLTCCHEESSVAMAHGYAKIEGKPMLALLHGTIGIQHAAMAIYNAYADRVPIYMIAGLSGAAVPAHAATDMAAMVRDYVKWDVQPETLDDFTQSAVQAYRLAMTPPTAPVLLVVDLKMQEASMPQRAPMIPDLTLPRAPSADAAAVREIAAALVDADWPLINCGRAARSQTGIDLIVELAELLQAPVNRGNNRTNFPSQHMLAGDGGRNPDLILNLETSGISSSSGARQISISSHELLMTGNYALPQGAARGDLIVAADAQASLPALIEEVKSRLTGSKRRSYDERGAAIAAVHRGRRAEEIQRAAAGWDASPVSVARICVELWDLIKDEDWSLVSPQGFISNWPARLWKMEKHYHYIGGQGAGGMGYGAPAAVGAALANRKYGRLSVNIQTDGDLCYAPAVLWTAAHHKIPLLTIMHNNRAYHQEVMFMQRAATKHNRRADRAHIGTTLIEPNIDYARMAESFGVYGEGPIADPNELRPALERGIARVKRGEPVLIDVVTQPR